MRTAWPPAMNACGWGAGLPDAGQKSAGNPLMPEGVTNEWEILTLLLYPRMRVGCLEQTYRREFSSRMNDSGSRTFNGTRVKSGATSAGV